jgi:superfamily I DNA/RNA helicase
VRLLARDVEAGRVSPTQRVLVLTFSRAARAQLDRYARELLSPDQRSRAEITNYHSFFWSKIWQYRTTLGLPLDLVIATDAEHRQDVFAAMTRAGLAEPGIRHRSAALASYAAALEYVVAEGRPERFDQLPVRLADVAEQLAAIHRGGRIYYDDMAYYMWRLVDESQTLRDLWAHKYPVVILDEFQDASPLQAAIVARFAPAPHRVYAFADPLQMIYGWRDASPRRLEDFERAGASRHVLRTLHRYRDRPYLQRWMEQVRDVLLGDRDRVEVPRPAEVEVISYDPTLPGGRVRGGTSRELYQLIDPLRHAFADPEIRSIGVMLRLREQIRLVENYLSQRFVCALLGDTDDATEWAREWVLGYAAAVQPDHHAARLLEVAETVAPRHPFVGDLRARICETGLNVDRLREPRRSLATDLNELVGRCESLAGAFAAAQATVRLVTADQDRKVVAWERVRVLRQVLRALPGAGDAEARAQVENRILQLRFATAAAHDRGLFLLSCHEGKGKEFDFVILPFLSAENFADDQESRQLLYVSLSRARKRILARVATGEPPSICERIGLA